MAYDPSMIEPMSDAQMAALKVAIEARWEQKRHYEGGPHEISSPACMMRAQEILSLIKRAEMTEMQAPYRSVNTAAFGAFVIPAPPSSKGT